ncbi:MAG: FHA domain-containing protein [Actinobacteria bacterium]|nr:FHA domain-containing protein [Actinomycetota bacterium]MBU1607927.1 FHA domain-containing protein [Actinomycetota bacterium]MBU2316103.1 FHA domain-containing protein [Actinomycetota bacterium]MBU2386051.1 FHA domain-containing protein [Actinomycetota bacterium]
MRLKLTLARQAADPIDLAITAESTTTVTQLARELHNADPLSQSRPGVHDGDLTVRLHHGDDVSGNAGVTVLDAASLLGDVPLGSGAVVSLVAHAPSRAPQAAPVAARLRIVSGPDEGRSFDLRAGVSTVGRDSSSTVVLSDPLVSKHHCRIAVTEVVEIIDSGSANGTLVDGQAAERVVLSADDLVTVGDTTLTIERLQGVVAEEGVRGPVAFNRSPRLDPMYHGVKLKSPEPPEQPEKQRLPWIALLAPLLMGAVIFAVSPNNPLSVVFVALSPLLMIASYIDNRFQNKRQWKRAVAQFDESVAAVEEDIRRLHEEERAGRRSESPTVAETVEAARLRSPLLWTRRPEHESYLALRLGTGALPSRHELEMPGQRKGPPDLWRKVENLQRSLLLVDDVPAVENLRVSGSVGVAGPGDAGCAVARGVLVNALALHSPAQLAVVALAPTARAEEWGWLKWTPHVGSVHSPLGGAPLATAGPAASALVGELEGLVADRAAEDAQGDAPRLPSILVIVDNGAPVERARLVDLAERGPAVGVHLLWVAERIGDVPAACRTFVELGASGGRAGFVHTGIGVSPVQCEPVTPDEALAFARSIAAVEDAGARVDDASDLPRSVSLLTLLGTELASESMSVIERWGETKSILTGPYASGSEGKQKSNLRAVFGQSATEPFALDLRTDGPHALVGGTTGSGKSEFLQAWVLGLAAAHSPQRVSFLFVDYKGGAAFADCVSLPHTVGLVTDLSPHLVRRALTSLRAELHYREHLFNRKKVKDIIELERSGDPEVPPSLLIIVDEFAALATEVPEFVDGVVDVAQRGRSLGLHLILATQRPAGVIKDNLRANTNLRVALRMADEADSADVLGTPLAATFDPSLPGRAAAKTGPGRLRVFQSGYAGGWTSDQEEPSRVSIETLTFGVSSPWEPRPDPEADERKRAVSEGPTDIKRIVATVREAAATAQIPEPRKPWLPELATVYDLSKLPNKRTDTELVLGVVDDAATQSQPTISYLPDRDGNMAIIGTGGSGKSTALRSIAVSAAITARGGPVQVYGLDFAAGGLQMLESLPHVGAVISGDDEERVGRLMRWLRDIVDDRAARFASARAGSIVDYRQSSGRSDEPRILLLLDGMTAFREAYEANVSSPWFSVFSQIATDGRQVGVHVVVTGDRAGAIPMSLSSSIQRRLVLRLANADDYAMLSVPGDVLDAASPPGRGILDGLEIQVGVLGGDGNVAVQARELEALAGAMRKAGVVDAPAVQRLADLVPLESLGESTVERALVGIADDNLQPVAVDPRGAFIIAGPPGSGRTTALETLATSLAAGGGRRTVLLSGRRSPLSHRAQWGIAVDTPEALEKAVRELLAEVDSGAIPPTALFLENIADFSGTPVEYDLERLIKAHIKAESFVVGEAETSTWSQAYTLGQPLRAGRRGLLVQPDDSDGDTLLNTSLGRIRRGTLPPGRGFLIERGRARKIHVAMAGDT